MAPTHWVQWPTRRKAGAVVAEHPSDRQGRGGLSTTEEILAVIAETEPHGVTADQVAHAIDRSRAVALIQDDLEELVEQGLLDRLGVGHGAVYTRNRAT